MGEQAFLHLTDYAGKDDTEKLTAAIAHAQALDANATIYVPPSTQFNGPIPLISGLKLTGAPPVNASNPSYDDLYVSPSYAQTVLSLPAQHCEMTLTWTDEQGKHTIKAPKVVLNQIHYEWSKMHFDITALVSEAGGGITTHTIDPTPHLPKKSDAEVLDDLARWLHDSEHSGEGAHGHVACAYDGHTKAMQQDYRDRVQAFLDAPQGEDIPPPNPIQIEQTPPEEKNKHLGEQAFLKLKPEEYTWNGSGLMTMPPPYTVVKPPSLKITGT